MFIAIFVFDVQIALLRIGMTDAGRGSLGNEALLTHDEVAAALANPLPSELLLRGELKNNLSFF